jgi:hypothetical protein
MLGAEVRLVLAACRPDRRDSLAELASMPLDWKVVLEVAEAERAAPVLWARLREFDIAVPAEAARAFHNISMLQEFHTRQVEARLTDAVGTLVAAGIEVMLLKGAALATTIYPSFIARPMSDADLLVRGAHTEAAWRLLQDHGWIPSETPGLEGFYREHHHMPRLHDARSGVPLEIHRALVAGDRPFALDAATLWKDARKSRLGAYAVLVPSPIHQLLHTAIHFAWSHALRKRAFGTFRDVDALLRARVVDLDALPDAARQARAASCCYWTLRLARSIGGADVPEKTLEALAPAVPRWLLPLIERHYSTALFPWLNGCPSVALDRKIWEVGMRPARNGLGKARPWDRDEEFLEVFYAEERAQNNMLRNQVARHRLWKRYVRALLSPAATP